MKKHAARLFAVVIAASPLAAGTALFGGSTIIAIPVIRRAAAEEANVSGVKTQVQ